MSREIPRLSQMNTYNPYKYTPNQENEIQVLSSKNIGEFGAMPQFVSGAKEKPVYNRERLAEKS